MTLECVQQPDGSIDLWDLFQDGGLLVRCWLDGRIELFQISQYGGEERSHGNFPTINAAIKEAEKWT